jgi:aspartate racemase
MIQPQLLILGLGSRSTLYYLREINRLYNEKKGGYSTCPLILLNTDFDKINPLLPKMSAQLDAVIQSYLDKIATLEITLVVFPNITLHETLDRLEINKNIIHPLHLSVSKIQEYKWCKVVLFGSLHSMQSNYIRSYFELNSIEVVIPSPSDMLFIDEVRKHVYNETETNEIINNYHSLIKEYAKNYPVVLCCTELSIVKPIGEINIIDMVQMQIEKAVKSIL